MSYNLPVRRVKTSALPAKPNPNVIYDTPQGLYLGDDKLGGMTADEAQAAIRNVAPTYKFFLPGRQFAGSGNIKDLSGNGADGVIQSGITDAQLWAARGYYSGVAANGGKCIVAADKSGFDLSRQSVIFSTVMNMANPAAGQAIFGNGAVGFFGFYLSLRPGGTMRPVIITADGNYNGLADSTAVFGDGTDHVVGLALDSETGEVKLYCDGALSNAYPANSFGRSQASQSTAAFGLLGQAGGGTTGYVGKAYGTHLLVKDGGLPTNLSLAMAQLAGAPAVHLNAADLDW
jgi:hypothetical protein